MTKLQAEIKKLFSKWEYLVTSYGWKFDVYYYDTYEDMPPKVEATPTTLMVTGCDFQHLRGDIHVNLRVCQNFVEENNETIEETVVHELVHLLVSPITDFDVPETPTEYVVTTLSRLFMGMRK